MSYLGTKPANQITADTLGNGTVTTEKLASSAINYVAPTGVVLPYGGSTAPIGWLICNGSAISRITYASLFSSIGTTYGAGDGSTTFNLPDLQNKVPVGSGGGKVLGASGGSSTQTPTIGSTTLSTSQIPSHGHDVRANSFAGDLPIAMGPLGPDGNKYSVTDSGNDASTNTALFRAVENGGGGSHNHTASSISVEQPFVVLTYIIKS